MHETTWMRFSNSRSDNRKSKIQNLKWAGFLALLVLLVGCVGMAEAQQSGKVRQIGVLSPGTPPRPVIEGLR